MTRRDAALSALQAYWPEHNLQISFSHTARLVTNIGHALLSYPDKQPRADQQGCEHQY